MKTTIENTPMRVLEIIKYLPETKREAVIDFASYLRNKEESDEFLKMQMDSKAYQNWLSPKMTFMMRFSKMRFRRGSIIVTVQVRYIL